jgi:hypothetical protein
MPEPLTLLPVDTTALLKELATSLNAFHAALTVGDPLREQLTLKVAETLLHTSQVHRIGAEFTAVQPVRWADIASTPEVPSSDA